MLLKYDYWYFTSVISSEQCDAIVLKYLKQKSKKAITGTESKKLKSKSKLNKKDLLDLKKTRNSSIVWITDVKVKNMIEILKLIKQSLFNLHIMEKTNITIGTLIVGTLHIQMVE